MYFFSNFPMNKMFGIKKKCLSFLNVDMMIEYLLELSKYLYYTFKLKLISIYLIFQLFLNFQNGFKVYYTIWHQVVVMAINIVFSFCF